MKKNLKIIISLILIALAIVALLIFDILKIQYTGDETLNKLLNATLPRLIAGGALLGIIIIFSCKQILVPDFKALPRHLLWCIPCFLVAIVNFPFTALIGGSAQILRSDLIPLFILECLSIGLMEELLFRGLLQDTIGQLFKDKPRGRIWTVLLTSALFGLIHLFNLFSGAGVGATFMQVGYSLLLGAMLSAIILRTNNIYLCIIIHAAFDVGGKIVPELGTGAFQDVYFWIFTAIAALLCLIHILFYLFKSNKPEEKK